MSPLDMMDALFPVPDRVALEVPGRRAWAYVMRIEVGCLWLVPGEQLDVEPDDTVRLDFFYPDDGPGIGMTGCVVWVGSDALSVAVKHPCDVDLTRAWAEGRAAALPTSMRRRVA